MFDLPVLNVPGIWDSGPAHWQTLWEREIPALKRVMQRDWDHPDVEEWCAALEAAAQDAGGREREIAVVAHSLGCLLVAYWAHRTVCRVRGALIVAVPDPAADAFPAEAAGFASFPRERWPFPGLVVASSDDPYASSAFAQSCAVDWGAEYVDVGPCGHINADSGLGAWSKGLALLRRVVEDSDAEVGES